jgi:hypothetical protein
MIKSLLMILINLVKYEKLTINNSSYIKININFDVQI